MSSLWSWVMILSSRSRARRRTLVPAQRRPVPMWWSRLLWRKGELAVGVGAVAADAEVLADADALACWYGAGAGLPGGCWGAAADGPVRPLVVVIAGEAVELGLQPADGGGGVLAGEPFFE